MKQSYYLFSAAELEKKDHTLRVITEDGVKRDLPIETVSELYLLNRMSFNTTFFDLMSKHKVPVHFFNYYTFYTGSFYPKEHNVSGSFLIEQVKTASDESGCLFLAREFVRVAAENKYRNLRYYSTRNKDVENEMKEIRTLIEILDYQSNIPSLMGVEGLIQQQYFKAWNTVIDREIDFEKRVKRPPDNMINTLISFVNTLVYTTVLSQIYMTHLNPTVSFLHSPSSRRFSLCLDIAEIFKPLIGDRVIFSLLNRNQLSDKDFTQGLDYLHLTQKGSQTVLSEYDKALERTITHPELERNVSYRYLIRLECYKLIKHILRDKQYKGFTIWW